MSSPSTKSPSILESMMNFQDHAMFSMGGTKKIIQIRYIINTFKFGVFVYIAFLMWYFQNFSAGAYLYMSLHGAYGWLWLFKDITFPDKSWQHYVPIGSASVYVLGNLFFYQLPLIMVSGLGVQDPSKSRVVVSVVTMIFGAALMLVADAQKTFTLKFKQGLISDGVFKYTRNPNYVGETLIYLSFAIATGHWLSYAIIFIQGFGLFNFMTYTKDVRSYSKKQGWKEYSAISGRFFPKIASNTLLTYAIYALAFAIGYAIYASDITLDQVLKRN